MNLLLNRADRADVSSMHLMAWSDTWVRRLLPPLLGVLVALLAMWAWLAVPTEVEPVAKVSKPVAAPAPAQTPLQIRDSKGVVGQVRLGMTIAAARTAVSEELVTVQATGPASRRFELVAPQAGLTLAGRGETVDTISVTNVGAGKRYVTARGVRIGDAALVVPRKYSRARRICGREWWVQRGSTTLRFGGRHQVTKITLTSARAPQYIDCF